MGHISVNTRESGQYSPVSDSMIYRRYERLVMRGEKPKKVRWHKKANVVKISIYLGVLTKWRARIYICTFHPTHGKTTIATSLSLLLIFHIFVLFIFQPSELSESITVTSHPSSHTHTHSLRVKMKKTLDPRKIQLFISPFSLVIHVSILSHYQ